MAAFTTPASEAIASTEAQSDYGSDIDEETITNLLNELESDSVKPLVLENIEEHELEQCLLHIPLFSSQGSTKTESTHYYSTVEEQLLEEAGTQIRSSQGRSIGYRTSSTLAQNVVTTNDFQDLVSQVEKEDQILDTRSPLERFRKPPQKPLSVTDIISPAWCELQYWYTLTKYGKKKQTPAMKQGTRVHQELEAQVHEIVLVEVKTREDAWGLRIWNTIQGLRTLRTTGLTRELEIWGVIEGEVVNGIIDEISCTCPDPDLEAALEESNASPNSRRPPNQLSITDFYAKSRNRANPWLSSPHPVRKVYITDIKTRNSKTLPRGSSVRPMLMQLMLYHRILTNLVSGAVDSKTIFSRYNLNPAIPFSNTFKNEFASLEQNFAPNTDSDTDYVPLSSATDALSELQLHDSLGALWDMMIKEFSRTIPSPDGVGSILRAEFRSQQDGTVLGSHCFTMDEKILEAYVNDEMKWWRGEREAKGVEVEEAYKCRVCEFAEGCEWRQGKIEEAFEKARLRRKSKSNV